MLINSISQSFGCSRISVSKEYPKALQKTLKRTSELKEIAKKNDVYLNISPSKKDSSNTLITIFRKKISHICDKPELALSQDTGDRIYINWEKIIVQKETETNPESIVNSINYLLHK